jgi:tetratricopeptide (TPR) repeat protein
VSENRLERLRLIAEQEPDDDLAQYGYGKACLDAGRLDEAIPALERATDLKREVREMEVFIKRAMRQLAKR